MAASVQNLVPREQRERERERDKERERERDRERERERGARVHFLATLQQLLACTGATNQHLLAYVF